MRRKKRTGVQMPVAAPVPTAAPVPAALPIEEQLDVELAPMADAPTRFNIKQFNIKQLSKRDFIMLGAGAGAMLVLTGFCWIASWVLSFFGG